VSGGEWISVAQVGDIDEDDAKQVRVGQHCVALFNVDGRYYATSDICTHALAYLSQGYIEGGTVECPLHQGRFDIATGRALSPPVTKNLAVYPVKVEDGRILVQLPAQG
jgi:NAD(P)H-dependent nitrite reductase small subunit